MCAITKQKKKLKSDWLWIKETTAMSLIWIWFSAQSEQSVLKIYTDNLSSRNLFRCIICFWFGFFLVHDQKETNANATLDQYWFKFFHMNELN